MIEYLKFIEELNEVKQYKHCPMMIKAIDILIEKYENLLQSKVSPSKEMTSLPNLDKINPDLHPIINTLWEANSFLKRAEKCLDHSELLRYFHESHENFYKSESEKDDIKEQIQKVKESINKKLTNYLDYREEAA